MINTKNYKLTDKVDLIISTKYSDFDPIVNYVMSLQSNLSKLYEPEAINIFNNYIFNKCKIENKSKNLTYSIKNNILSMDEEYEILQKDIGLSLDLMQFMFLCRQSLLECVTDFLTGVKND